MDELDVIMIQYLIEHFLNPTDMLNFRLCNSEINDLIKKNVFIKKIEEYVKLIPNRLWGKVKTEYSYTYFWRMDGSSGVDINTNDDDKIVTSILIALFVEAKESNDGFVKFILKLFCEERKLKKAIWFAFRGCLVGGNFTLMKYLLYLAEKNNIHMPANDTGDYLYEEDKNIVLYEGLSGDDQTNLYGKVYYIMSDILRGGNMVMYKFLKDKYNIYDMDCWDYCVYYSKKVGHTEMKKYFKSMEDQNCEKHKIGNKDYLTRLYGNCKNYSGNNT